jgi:multiple sugar transport system substrate-binding protein
MITRRDVLKYGVATGAVGAGLAAPAIAQAPTTLTLMTYESLPATQAVLREQAAAFEAAHPGVKVNPSFSSGEALRTQVASMLQSGIAPDVVMLDLEDALLYSRNKVLEPVTDIVEGIAGLPGKYRARVDGADYYVPVGIKFTYTFYRKDLFEKAGLQPAKTWDAFATAAEKLTGNGQYGYVLSSAENFDYPVSQMFAYAFSNGVQFIDDEGNVVFDQGDNKKAFAETLAFLKRLSAASPNGSNIQWGAVIDAYTSGRVAMADFIGARLLAVARQNNPPVGNATGTTPLAYHKGPGNRLAAQGYMTFQKSRNKDLAQQLVRFLADPKRNEQFLWSTSMHVLPASSDTFRGGWRDNDFIKANPDVLKTIEASWDYGHSPVYDFNGKKPAWQRVRVYTSTTYNKIISAVVAGGVAPEQAIDDGAAAARQLIRRG